jgi:hypothetical protein
MVRDVRLAIVLARGIEKALVSNDIDLAVVQRVLDRALAEFGRTA